MTKLNSSNNGNFTERLDYNKDPLSLNRNKMSFDEDGNLNVASSPSPSPIRYPPTTDEEAIEEAKTF